MYRILIVEDDQLISREIEKQLMTWDFEARRVEDFDFVFREFEDFEPHLVLMDIKLPVLNGYLWCEKIRKVSNVPIIFISSAGDNMNLIMAINSGGDDFIKKPFEMEVLISKIKALLRRSYDYVTEKSYEFGPLVHYPEKMIIRVGENEEELSKNENNILQLLLEKRGKVVTREELMIKLWDTESFIDDNTLTVNVNRLRNKLKENGMEDIIKTKKGVGYYI